LLILAFSILICGAFHADAQQQQSSSEQHGLVPADPRPPIIDPTRNYFGLDIMFSNDGFGLGTYYRRVLTPDLSWVLAFSVSESKDPREIEQYDPYLQQSYVPGKLNRFLVVPLTLGLEYRLFREDIVDTFKPYVTAGAGPALVYQMPYSDLSIANGALEATPVDFFKALGRGHANYTGTAFVGAGANVGSESSNVFGVSFRYYFTYLFNDGLPSLFDIYTGDIASKKKSFGGFCIMLNIGMGY
jgi:hypothetical protein